MKDNIVVVEDLRLGLLVLLHVVNDWYIDNFARCYLKLNYHRNKVLEHTKEIPDIVREKMNDKVKIYIQKFINSQYKLE